MPNYIITQEDLNSMPQELKRAFLEYLANDAKSKIDALEDTIESSKNDTSNDEILKLLSKMSEIGPARVEHQHGVASESIEAWFAMRKKYSDNLNTGSLKVRKVNRHRREVLLTSLQSNFRKHLLSSYYFTLEAALVLCARLNSTNRGILKALSKAHHNILSREALAKEVGITVPSLNGCISSINRAFKYSFVKMFAPERPSSMEYDFIGTQDLDENQRTGMTNEGGPSFDGVDEDELFYSIAIHLDSIRIALRILEELPEGIRTSSLLKNKIGLMNDKEDILSLNIESIRSAIRGECFVHNGVITQIGPSYYIDINGELLSDCQDTQNEGPTKPYHLKDILIGDELEKAIKSKETGEN